MTDYVKAYDAYIKSYLKEKTEENEDIKEKDANEEIEIKEKHVVSQKVIEYHRLQISYLQHERLIHLIVTALVSLLLFGSFCLMLWITSMPTIVLCLIFLFVDGFYLMHYYFLENKVQAWYVIEKKLVDIYDKKS